MTSNLWPKCKGFAHQAAVRKHIDKENRLSPVPYPETINLPFNYASISKDFVPLTHSGDHSGEENYWAIIQGGNLVTADGDAGPGLPFGPLPDWLEFKHHPLLIGRWMEKPLYALSVSSALQLRPPYRAEPFNASGEQLDIRTLTLGGLARQILHWDRQSRHCPLCGSETGRMSGNWGKRCISCNSEHYPHIHPCAIVLVKRDDRILLCRKAEWAPGRYGLVAGFLDFGESLEECAIREVREETGIEICNVRYAGSQNWPFPAQLMAGFVADYASGEIKVDSSELEDAQWFKSDQLPSLPPLRSIARWIIDNFK